MLCGIRLGAIIVVVVVQVVVVVLVGPTGRHLSVQFARIVLMDLLSRDRHFKIQ